MNCDKLPNTHNIEDATHLRIVGMTAEKMHSRICHPQFLRTIQLIVSLHEEPDIAVVRLIHPVRRAPLPSQGRGLQQRLPDLLTDRLLQRFAHHPGRLLQQVQRGG